MAEVKTGWLKDYEGNKFAPKTDASQVLYNNDGNENVQEILSKKPGRLVEGETLGGVVAGTDAEVFNDIEHNIATGYWSHAEGLETQAVGDVSHAEGAFTKAFGTTSHAEGYGTEAASNNQHVQGRYNIKDNDNKYAHIVGNGISDSNTFVTTFSNAHTLDWDGNAWYQGHIYTGGTDQDDGVPMGGLVSCSYNGDTTTAQTITDVLTGDHGGGKSNFTSYSQANKYLQDQEDVALQKAETIYEDWLNNLKTQYGQYSIIDSESHPSIGHLQRDIEEIEESHDDGNGNTIIELTYTATFEYEIMVDVKAMIGAVQQIDNAVLPDSTFLMKFLLASSMTANLLVNGNPVIMTNMDGSNIYGSDKYTYKDILLCYYDGSSVKVLNSITPNILEISKGGTGRGTLTTSNINYTYRASKFSTTIPTSVDEGCLVYVYAETETV